MSLFKKALNTSLIIVIGLLFVYIGNETFNKPSEFAGLVVASLIGTAIICRKEPNVLGAILIVFACRIMDLAAFPLLDSPSHLTKLISYPLFGYLIYLTRGIMLTLPMFITLSASIFAEVYWYFTEYDAPQILWYMFSITLNSIYIFLIDCRLIVVHKLFPNKMRDLEVDIVLRGTGMAFIVITIIMIVEYIARHLGITGSQAIYGVYSYIGHIISIVVLWAIFHQTYLLKSRRMFKA